MFSSVRLLLTNTLWSNTIQQHSWSLQTHDHERKRCWSTRPQRCCNCIIHVCGCVWVRCIKVQYVVWHTQVFACQLVCISPTNKLCLCKPGEKKVKRMFSCRCSMPLFYHVSFTCNYTSVHFYLLAHGLHFLQSKCLQQGWSWVEARDLITPSTISVSNYCQLLSMTSNYYQSIKKASIM